MKAELESLMQEGGHCPHCGQYVKLYKRKLNRTMARGLIWFIREWHMRCAPNYLHVNDFAPRWLVRSAGEFAKLEHWGLIEQASNDDHRKRTSGYWRPTGAGLAFVRGTLRVAARVHLYNNKVVGTSQDTVSISDAMGEPFDYDAMMRGDALEYLGRHKPRKVA